MNGYGPFAASLFWFHLYWGIAAIALAIITNTLWVRGTGKPAGTPASRGHAFHSSDYRFRWLVRFFWRSEDDFYNTNVLNPYYTTYAIDGGCLIRRNTGNTKIPKPRSPISTQIDLDEPYRHMRGTMMLGTKHHPRRPRNHHGAAGGLRPCRRPIVRFKNSRSPAARHRFSNNALGFFFYRRTPLPPGDRIALDYSVSASVGFVNGNPILTSQRNLPE
jgi:hypothetical protein